MQIILYVTISWSSKSQHFLGGFIKLLWLRFQACFDFHKKVGSVFDQIKCVVVSQHPDLNLCWLTLFLVVWAVGKDIGIL